MLCCALLRCALPHCVWFGYFRSLWVLCLYDFVCFSLVPLGWLNFFFFFWSSSVYFFKLYYVRLQVVTSSLLKLA